VTLGQAAWKTERPVKRNGHYIYDTCARTVPACLLGVPLEFAPERPKKAALGRQREASEGIASTNYEMEGHVPPAGDWVMNLVANRLLKPEGILQIGAPVSWFPRTSQR
jgi:hypothetical protein